MFNANTGWSVTYDPLNHNHILHTTAGVTHWQDVTPAPGSQRAFMDATDFMDPMTTWVTVATGTHQFLYHTHDGGQSWQKAQLPDKEYDPIQIFFLNTQVGWIMFLNAATTGSMAVDLLHTSDGGASWKLISGCNFMTANNPTAIPCEGDKGGLSFLNEKVGWLTGFTNENLVLLYKTTDGGMTWHHQSLPLPVSAYTFQISTMPPVFFNATSGFLPAIIPSTTGQITIIYVTHDGGATWHATTPIATSVTALDFVDAMHGWIVTNTFDANTNQYNSTTIYQTNDGEEHWTQRNIKLGADITSIDFVSPIQGWAIDSLHSLYQTTDSGQTWTKVTPMLTILSQR
jgi:photosystem II stability/assembly factor-like uncharacterized protein